MHLHTKIPGPSCRCTCQPAGTSICPTREGIKCSLSQSHTQIRFSWQGSEQGVGWCPQARPATWGSEEEGLLPYGWLTEVPTLWFHIQLQSLWRSRTPLILWRREVSGGPWSMPLSEKSLPECPWQPAPTVCPNASGDRAQPHCPLGSLLLPRATGSLRLFSLKIEGLYNHWISLCTQYSTRFHSLSHRGPGRRGQYH